MKLPKFFIKMRVRKSEGSFADFFLHASPKEKRRVIEDAARRANEDQRAVSGKFNKVNHKTT